MRGVVAFYSYDSYPQFSAIYPDAGVSPLLDRKWGLNLTAPYGVLVLEIPASLR